ncbi:conserved hypothetical protein [Gloeothece citriformis PCC 7424]|uniref:Uncharacterized protein n=1 Tax=Gloeothece citriformis (strain PCC 7424) TaxID=65393 RepID=B7KF30_GLOC7|nr:hypothetical protein [Gloeothece citriformis]ACK70486.1 conserved hypothetical protein [Gloeothece citriformis PCC 7424]
MNILLPRFLKSAYRKEPISAFILIVGAVDAVIGGVGERWTLLSLGVSIVFLATILRWWKTQQVKAMVSQETPKGYLPPSSSRTPLPMLMNEKRRR